MTDLEQRLAATFEELADEALPIPTCWAPCAVGPDDGGPRPRWRPRPLRLWWQPGP